MIQENYLIASAEAEELDEDIEPEVNNDADANFNESPDVNNEANGNLSTKSDASSEGDSDINDESKENVGLDLSTDFDNELEGDTDGDNDRSIDLGNGLNADELTLKVEGAFNIGSNESLDFDTGIDKDYLDFSEDLERDIKSDGSSSGDRDFITQFMAEILNLDLDLDENIGKTTVFSTGGLRLSNATGKSSNSTEGSSGTGDRGFITLVVTTTGLLDSLGIGNVDVGILEEFNFGAKLLGDGLDLNPRSIMPKDGDEIKIKAEETLDIDVVDVKMKDGEGLGEDLELGEPSGLNDESKKIGMETVVGSIARLVSVRVGNVRVQTVSSVDNCLHILNSGINVNDTAPPAEASRSAHGWESGGDGRKGDGGNGSK